MLRHFVQSVELSVVLESFEEEGWEL